MKCLFSKSNQALSLLCIVYLYFVDFSFWPYFQLVRTLNPQKNAAELMMNIPRNIPLYQSWQISVYLLDELKSVFLVAAWLIQIIQPKHEKCVTVSFAFASGIRSKPLRQRLMIASNPNMEFFSLHL